MWCSCRKQKTSRIPEDLFFLSLLRSLYYLIVGTFSGWFLPSPGMCFLVCAVCCSGSLSASPPSSDSLSWRWGWCSRMGGRTALGTVSLCAALLCLLPSCFSAELLVNAVIPWTLSSRGTLSFLEGAAPFPTCRFLFLPALSFPPSEPLPHSLVSHSCLDQTAQNARPDLGPTDGKSRHLRTHPPPYLLSLCCAHFAVSLPWLGQVFNQL